MSCERRTAVLDAIEACAALVETSANHHWYLASRPPVALGWEFVVEHEASAKALKSCAKQIREMARLIAERTEEAQESDVEEGNT